MISRTTVNDLANMLSDKREENINLNNEIQSLKQQLADAEKVIDFYAYASMNDHLVINMNEKAREYKSKYKVGE